ncbi:molybdenum cofactor guanylyltransferase [Sporichthya sp.]|uniref:molybdenum cofactor guanylyltransferase n=1 Tax=Sporichthya sp. TaxID=65475 RepID=UPI0025F384C9|nr:molybdenum cofactor guanylyltransferase [Sporichthya sp.]
MRTHAAAGVILAGGRSSRMGTPKFDLDWHGTSLLYRMAALMKRSVFGQVVVVGAPGQNLTDLPEGVQVVHDPTEGLGPLQGLAAGLTAVADSRTIAFVCSVDMPFLHPVFVRQVLAAMDEVDVALPVVHGYRQPLAAGYRTELGERITAMLAEGARKPGELFEKVRLRELSAEDLLADPDVARLDPNLDSVRNLNTPEEYEQALSEMPPEVAISVHGTWMDQGQRREATLAAPNLGGAAMAIGLDLGATLMVTVNAERIGREPEFPLVRGDALSILSANVPR